MSKVYILSDSWLNILMYGKGYTEQAEGGLRSQEFQRSYPTCHGETQASANHPERNEDALCTGKKYAGVFDGMGSKKGSEIASSEAAKYCEIALGKVEDELYPHEAQYELEKILYDANEAIVQHAKTIEGDNDLYTTVVIAKIFTHPETRAKFAVEAHVGDSRMYHVRNGKIIYKTTDHSSEFFEIGDKDESAMQDALDQVTNGTDLDTSVEGKDLRNIFKRRNQIASSLSSQGKSGLFVRSSVHNLMPGDVLLLTSDGIHDNLTQAEIETICSAYIDNPLEIPDQLIIEAERRSYENDSIRSKIDDMTAASLISQ